MTIQNKKILWIGVITVGVIIILAAVIPNWNVWRKELAGKGQLREAEWNRRILVEEAEAKRQASTLEAQAEVERAKGVAEANQIIGDSLDGSEA